ncbi:MAG: hypothetical protein KDB94_09380 [Acidobacteria bacterium]|nr:hypothetical protein [Acidobacteriota bacterium]MCB9378230.1 hypothetical protein [Holophagales bacterium]
MAERPEVAETTAPRPPFRYRREVLAALESHGLRPTGEVEPLRTYELLKSIYVFEIRGLKADFHRLDPRFGPSTRAAYAEANRRLLERYALLRVPPHEWVERAGTG